jgi:hypothetical protein
VLRHLGRVLLVVAGLQLGVQLVGCGSKKDYVCQSRQTVCGQFQVCCTEGDCHLAYNGRQYTCNGANCDAAAVQFAAIMCSGAPGALNASTKDAAEALKQTSRELATKARDTRCPVCP